MLISFIVTTYNLPIGLLRECLDSILAVALTAEEREIILVDDGSAVAPYAELEAYHDVITYLRQENKGLSEARNAGLAVAQGDYIQFVDGDDCLVPQRYNIIVDKLQHEDGYVPTDIVLFGAARTKHPRMTLATLIKLFWYNTNKEYLKKKNLHAAAWGYVVRRTVLGDLRFTPGIYHEDEEFTPLLLLRMPYVHFTSIKAYYYRAREASITLDPSPEHIARRLHDLVGVIVRLRHRALTDAPLLTRRVHQLTMDYVYNALRLADNYDTCCHYLEPLLASSLLPLPLRRYTATYLLFALLTRAVWARKGLYKLLRRR